MNEDRTAGGEGTGASQDGFSMWTPGNGGGSENRGRKQVLLYGRVSTEEQARGGYSLGDQMDQLRKHAARNDWDVVDEVPDEGGSGATLHRYGIERVRDLVKNNPRVSAVVASKRDRITRDGLLRSILEQELEMRGCALVALDDSGDRGPMGKFMNEIRDAFSKLERETILERTERGKRYKARMGKIMRTRKPPYGFRYNDTHDGLVIYEPEMEVVERIFRMAAEGLGPGAISRRLYEEGVRSPTGKLHWRRPVIKRLVLESDLYRPHAVDELADLVEDVVLDRLEAGKAYGLWYFNRHRVKTNTVPVPGSDGNVHFKKRTTKKLRPREEWIAVPSPATASLPRWLVDRGRQTMSAQRGTERKYEARPWELRGLMRCRCGARMTVKTTQPGGKIYHYYTCDNRVRYGRMSSCQQKSLPAPKLEKEVWSFLHGVLKDPQRLLSKVETLAEQERSTDSGVLSRRSKELNRELDNVASTRVRYQEMAARNLMSFDELETRLGDLEKRRGEAEAEMRALQSSRERLEQLEANKEAVLEGMSRAAMGALDRTTPEDRVRIYKMLGLQVIPSAEGHEVRGVFCGIERPSTAT